MVKKELLPSFIEIETSTYCNRRCPWCPNSIYKRGRAKKGMSFALFTKIIKDLQKIDYNGLLALHGYNEPLLDKNLCKYLEIVKTKLIKARIIIFTNGDYLNLDILNKLKSYGVSTLYISFHDGIGNKNYKKLLFKHLKKIGKAKSRLENASDVFGKKFKLHHGKMEIIYYIPNHQMMTSRGGIIKNLEKVDKHDFCYLPFASSAIDYEGNMKICCEIYPAHTLHRKIGLIGNLKNKSFYDLWFSDKYNILRKSFLSNNIKNQICLACLKNNENIHHTKIAQWAKFLDKKEPR